MAKNKPGIPKGTRDFGPVEVARRDHIFSTIKSVFQLHGFMPVETPAMETLDTLMGKYGEEGDRLIFKILNSGDYLSELRESDWYERDSLKLSSKLCEKALRYDLTVPFARYVVQNQHQITFPFRRYQIQPVWRADRPQKGRYREFYQCDVDIIGSDSLLNEAEFLHIIAEVFDQLGIQVVIKINNRKILAGIASYIGHADKLTDITVAIDKMEKVGLERVRAELAEKGLDTDAVARLQPVLMLSGSTAEKLDVLSDMLQHTETGLLGIKEVREVFELLAADPVSCAVELDLTLARGLNYYTGAIIEVKAAEVQMGSICGGGRYDDLTGVFGLPGVSGVGISFGADRIYDVLMELQKFPATTSSFTRLLAVHFGHEEMKYCLPVLRMLRSHGISCEMYPDDAKMKKQMQYADKNRIPLVLVAGTHEMQEGVYNLKNMHTGEQRTLQADEILEHVKAWLRML